MPEDRPVTSALSFGQTPERCKRSHERCWNSSDSCQVPSFRPQTGRRRTGCRPRGCRSPPSCTRLWCPRWSPWAVVH